MTGIFVKRVYAAPAATDGCRVLVDRLWPRGLSKEKAAVDHWFRQLAPSNELRRWYGHDPEKWNEFRNRYRAELDADRAVLEPLIRLMETEKTVTLLFGSREERFNNAVALADILQNK